MRVTYYMRLPIRFQVCLAYEYRNLISRVGYYCVGIAAVPSSRNYQMMKKMLRPLGRMENRQAVARGRRISSIDISTFLNFLTRLRRQGHSMAVNKRHFAPIQLARSGFEFRAGLWRLVDYQCYKSDILPMVIY